ncbi:MAG: carbon-nitrogen hydrolase family protein [Flavobacteriales bacterium]|nr:carbon-nitrogen hydrolase family protein [Flavobacteriales bacterium]
MELNIAVVQLNIAPSDPLKNMERMEEFVAKAKKKGADLIVFPEDAICGPLTGQTTFVQHAPAYMERMQGLAATYAIDLVPGTWTVQEDVALYNQACYINADGTVAGIYRKVNLWETEKIAITPGTLASVFPTRFGNVGLIVCWDIAFPQLFAAMNAQGAQLVISPTYWSFPEGTTKDAEAMEDEIHLIDSLCTTRAFENNIVFVYCNAAGVLEAGGTRSVLSGRSQITHPADKILDLCEGNKEKMIITNVQLP